MRKTLAIGMRSPEVVNGPSSVVKPKSAERAAHETQARLAPNGGQRHLSEGDK
jgi:hypothetical protein